MTERNQKIFRRILIGLGILCVFLLGCVIKLPVSLSFFAILAALTGGLTLGYMLGTGKEIRLWKGLKFKLVRDEDKNKK